MKQSLGDKRDLHILLTQFKESIKDIKPMTATPPEFIPRTSLLQISSGDYTEIVPGVYDRLMKDQDDWTSIEEKNIFQKYVKDLDFKRYYVILVRFNKGATFGLHIHPETEYIHVIKGAFVDLHTHTTYATGDTQMIQANQSHTFHPIADGYAVVTLGK